MMQAHKRKAADAELEGQRPSPSSSSSKSLCTGGAPEAPSLMIIVSLHTSDIKKHDPPRRVGLSLPAAALAELRHQPLSALQKAALQQLKEDVFSQEDVYLTSGKWGYGVTCDMACSLDYFTPAVGAMSCLYFHCFAWTLNCSGKMQIIVKTMANTSVPIEVCANETVGDLKRKFQEKEGIPPDQQRLLFDRYQLEDVCPIGCVEGLQEMSKVYLVLRLRGGGVPPPVFADVSNESSLEKFGWATSGPDWRKASPGLNVEGKCENPRCAAHKRMVICCMDFRHFDLSLDHCACPMCREEIKPVTCAFSNCQWAFSGTKLEGGQPVAVESGAWKDAGNCYERFKSDSSNQVHWERLLLITRPSSIEHSSFPPGAECSICFDGTDNQEAVAAPCSKAASSTPHLFHKDCITAWLARSSECPLCRADITSMRVSLSVEAQQAEAQAADEKDSK